MKKEDKIREICSYKAGWLNGYGEAVYVNPEWAIKVYNALIAAGFKDPSIFPSEEGNLAFEWKDGRVIYLEPGNVDL